MKIKENTKERLMPSLPPISSEKWVPLSLDWGGGVLRLVPWINLSTDKGHNPLQSI